MAPGIESDEAKPFLEEDPLEAIHRTLLHKSHDRRLLILPWIISAISWIAMSYLLFSRQSPRSAAAQPIEDIAFTMASQPSRLTWPTDFDALRSTIEYETRIFTGALLYDETSKRFYRNISSEEVMYAGPPSEAIDAAWEELLTNEWTPMTDKEAAPYLPTLKTFNAQYLFEPDMFHSLHCLNAIRKRIDIDYYSLPEHADFKIDQEDWHRIHIDHCLDQLRQTIMCFGDVSPVPLYSWDGAPLGLGRGTEHTCRKWEPIRQWVDQRHLEMQVS